MRACASLLTLIICLSLLLPSCGGMGSQPDDPTFPSGTQPQLAENPPGMSGLPMDGLQPWEQLDSNGNAVDPKRDASSINANTDFTPGVERFLDGGDAVSNGEALRLNEQGGTQSYAMYRVSLQGGQPAIVSVDANLFGSGSEYYVGLSNYGNGRWKWQGPYVDSHVRIPAVLDGNGDFTSSLGNTFVTVMVTGNSALDIVGIGVNQFDPADSQLPAAPGGISLQPVRGGLELSWSPVLAADLAGYRIYYSDESFASVHAVGVRSLNYLEGSTRHVLGGLAGLTWIRLTSLDFGGNESDPSVLLAGLPLAGEPPPLELAVDAASGTVNAILTLSAGGAESYDWDLDGDGVFEVTGNSSGMQAAYTGSTGIIRPRVRASSGGGEAVALGGLSLIITGNTRPVASATAAPQSGVAPLEVTFSGQASDQEDDNSALTFAWDFEGDGIFEPDTDTLNPAVQNYAAAGTYNAKLKVSDTDGAWDVDTLAVSVSPGIGNAEPVAILTVDREAAERGEAFQFSAAGSFDSDGSISDYEWDLDGDGTFNESDNGEDAIQGNSSAQMFWPESGIHTVNLRVTDDQAATGVSGITVTVRGWLVLKLSELGAPPEFNMSDTALALVNGHPALAVYDGASKVLRFGRAKDAYGAAWPELGLVEDYPGDRTGLFPSLAVVDGLPAIAYLRGDVELRFIRASDENGFSWAKSATTVESGDFTSSNSLRVVDGRPAIACYNSTDADLEYYRSTTTDGSSWEAPIVVNADNANGQMCSLAIVDGRPAIAYRGYDGGSNARYNIADDSSGSAWTSAPVDLTAPFNSGRDTSLAVVHGLPAVACRGESSDVVFIRAEDAAGSSWTEPIQVDNVLSSGNNNSMAIVHGRPVIFSSGAEIYYSEALDSAGQDWAPAVVVADGGRPRVLEVNGMPAISFVTHVDFNYSRVFFARLY